MEVEEEVARFVPAQHLSFKHLGAVAAREGRKRGKKKEYGNVKYL